MPAYKQLLFLTYCLYNIIAKTCIISEIYLSKVQYIYSSCMVAKSKKFLTLYFEQKAPECSRKQVKI